MMCSQAFHDSKGFDFEKYKSKEEDYGIGKMEEREFKVIRFENSYYEGEVKKGTAIAHGRGFYIGQCLYIGYWRENKRHGKGLYIDKDGDYSLGDWTDDKKHGDAIERQNGQNYRTVYGLDESVYYIDGESKLSERYTEKSEDGYKITEIGKIVYPSGQILIGK